MEKKTVAEIQVATKLGLKNYLLDAIADSYFPHVPQDLQDRIKYTVMTKDGAVRNLSKIPQKELIALAMEWNSAEEEVDKRVQADRAAKVAKEAKKPAKKRLGSKKKEQVKVDEKDKRKALLGNISTFVNAQESPGLVDELRVDASYLERAKLALSKGDSCSVVALESLWKELIASFDELPKKQTAEKKEEEPVQMTLESEEETKAPVPEPESKGKKRLGKKKSEPAEQNASATPAVSTADIMFPPEIKDSTLGTLVKVPDKYPTMAEVRKAQEGGLEIYLAFYWPQKLVKQYSYIGTYHLKGAEPVFPRDLDIVQPILFCDTISHCVAISQYTEALYLMEGENSFTPIDAKDANGPYKVRVSAGCEFEVYLKK